MLLLILDFCPQSFWQWGIGRLICPCPHVLAWKNTDVNLLTITALWLVSLDLICPCSIYYLRLWVVYPVMKCVQTLLMLIRSPVHLCTCVASMQGIGWWFDQWINIAIHSPHPPFWSVLFPFCRNDCYSIPFRVVSVLFAYDWCADRRINLPPTWWDHIIWIICCYGL